MRSVVVATFLVSTALLSGCGQKYEASAPEMSTMAIKEAPATAGVAADAAAPPAPANAPPPSAAIPVSTPKIAYVYSYGYRIGASEIAPLQRKHADLCEKQGPQICRIVAMSSSGEEGDYAHGELHLLVAAPRARAFGVDLAKVADDAGGSEVSSSITGEDLSKQIVDTEARLKARTLLRDRLMDVLASRKGSVAELVEAERGVAQVNEEIDQARAWLTEMNTRVDFSQVNIEYDSGSPSSGGFFAPIRAVFGSLGSILGTTIAALIGLAAVLLPLGLAAWGLRKLWLRWRPRRVAEDENPSTTA